MDETSIIEITNQGLEYVDEDGKRQFIDFSICHQNYLKRWSDPDHLSKVKTMNNMDDERLEKFLKNIRRVKEIGKRNPLESPWADGPFIEFYTVPPARFRFTNLAEYTRVRDAIGEAGWITFDQS